VTAEGQTLKKDHRGLRRRPLYSPFAIMLASIAALVLAVGWLGSAWSSTTIVLVRHADKRADGPDPGLSEQGRAQAERLAGMLAETGLAAIYVSEARRTLETAAPVALATGVVPEVIPAKDLRQLLRRLKSGHRGGVVLVVGHSNTVPAIAAGLGAPIPDIDDADFSGLWIVSHSGLRGTRLLTLRY
jgi:broad specificity phosphatase PhoE